MISVKEAKELIHLHTHKLQPKLVSLDQAFGKHLAQDILAPISSPPFDQSAMDGYAFCWNQTNRSEPIEISSVSQTGQTHAISLKPGTASRIYTGAPVPNGADTIIIQEHVKVVDSTITIHDLKISEGANIRKKGSQIELGEIAVKAGTKLNAGVIGYIAGLGINELSIYPEPKIGIIITGKELVASGAHLDHGQVYESNSILLEAALVEGNIRPYLVRICDDIEEEISNAIKEALDCCDMVLVTGGISVGDFDFVAKAFHNNEVETLFHKIKQKPGKPLYYGKKEDKMVFGLPGNPSSVASCFYHYVVPCIRKMMGFEFGSENKQYLPLGAETFKKAGLTTFLKGRSENGFVYICEGQESYKLSAFTQANCFVVLEEEEADFKEGKLVEVHPFQDFWA
ncbi:MAG: molybdopterin molybdenumtransferase [Bacteroidetes bacterium B1(2017)]|nr:MAG: molybdopterin molybdenumtransferase [Bacteroidetes bacterium B1(2017)]